MDIYYEEVLGQAPVHQFSLDLDRLDLPAWDLSHLDMPFTKDEVLKIIKAMPLDKAPGPDRFTGRFFYICWAIIKEDFMRAMEYFHRGDMRGLGSVNKALISLLPKKDEAMDIRDFRPVSLVQGPVKIFAKVLSGRLTDDLPALVGAHQSAFVCGRSIHDKFMMVQGTARRLHALREPAVMLKLDISKAFDTVQWPFLLEVLSKLGFSDRWISWICGLLSTSSTRVMDILDLFFFTFF